VVNNGANWAYQPGWYLIGEILERWFSKQWPLMVGLALAGAATVVYGDPARGWRVRWRPLASSALMVMWVIVPVALMFVTNMFIPTLSTRRITQITPAIALLFAFGLSNFRNPARGFLIAVIVLYGVLYLDFNRYDPDWREVARLTTEYALPGNLVLSDVSGGDYQLLYYLDQYLPPGVTVRSLKVWRDFEPQTYAQVGQLVGQYDGVWLTRWSDDAQIFGWLHDSGHVQSAARTIEHIGSTINVLRFDRLPDEPVVEYLNGMTLSKVALYPDLLRVDLWWSLESPVGVSYTTSAFLLDEGGRLVAQFDSFPFDGERPTTGWSPGEVVYDPKPLVTLDGRPLSPGRYSVGVQIYTLADGVKIRTVDGDPWAVVGQIER
jgi:hypothetical protein